MATVNFIEFIENYFGIKSEEFSIDYLYRMGLNDNDVKRLNAHIGVTNCSNVTEVFSLICALIVCEANMNIATNGDNVVLSWTAPNGKLIELGLPSVAVLEQ